MKIEAVFQRPPGSHFGRLWAPNERFRIENGSEIWPKMASKRIPDRVFDSELVFQSIFIDFWAVFWMIFRCCFGSSHHVNEKCECSESPHFYNRFCRFYCSAEVWKSLKNLWKTMLTCTCWRPPKTIPKITFKKLRNGSKINKKSMLEAIQERVQCF